MMNDITNSNELHGAIDIDDLTELLNDNTIEDVVMNHDTPIILTAQTRKINLKSSSVDPTFISAFDLFNKNIEVIPSLLEPFLQKTGLASLVGASDSGKSTFLRQLSVSIAMNLKTFLGFPLNSKYCKSPAKSGLI